MAKKYIAKSKFDFEIPYSIYPRQGEGRAAGMKRLATQIQTEEDYKLFCLAVKNYADLCKKEARQIIYIKHWITFVNNWQDYLQNIKPVTTTNSTKTSANISQIERIIKGEL